MDHDKAKEPILNRRLLLFLAAMAFAEAARTMTMVQVPIFLRELGANIQQIGLFFTISMVFPLLLRVIGGWLSDTIGRLRALTIGSIAGVLTYLSFSIAPTWQAALLGPAFLAITSALIFPSYKAFIADQTPEHAQGRVFGISETIITIAWIAGPPLGGLLAESLGYRAMFIAATISFTIAAGIFSRMARQSRALEEQPQRPNFESLRRSLTHLFALMMAGGLVTWILIVDGVRDVAFKLSFDLMPIYLTEIGHLSKSQIGLMDGLFGIALALTTLPAGWLVDKTSERVGISLGLIIMVLSRLVFAVAGAFWGFAGSWILLGIGGGLLDPAGSSLIAKGVPRKVRGLTYGLVATSLGILSLPAPWIGSQIWKILDPQAPFLLTVVLGSLAIIPAWIKLVLPEKVPQGSAVAFTQLRFEKGNTAGGTYAQRAQERYYRSRSHSSRPFERE